MTLNVRGFDIKCRYKEFLKQESLENKLFDEYSGNLVTADKPFEISF
jgi:hypothetical protein